MTTDSLENRYSHNDFKDNPESQVPCVIMLDTSLSMAGVAIDEVNAGIRRFKEELAKDELTERRADIAVVAFNHGYDVVQDFGRLADFNPPRLAASGGTRFAPAINRALDMIEARKAAYRAAGLSYYRPIAMLVTDGRPEHDTPDDLAKVAERIKESENGRHLVFWAIGTERADMDALSRLSSRPPKMLAGTKFGEMFEWLSASISRISHSAIDEEVELPSTSGWSRY